MITLTMITLSSTHCTYQKYVEERKEETFLELNKIMFFKNYKTFVRGRFSKFQLEGAAVEPK
jgi:hypothetical protein